MASRRLFFYELPGNLRGAAGGSRRKIKLSRSWQGEIVVSPETCELCRKRNLAVFDYGLAGKWRVVKNIFTPYSFHQMVIPEKCWDQKKLRELGGVTKIQGAFRAIQSVVEANPRKISLFVSVHIGSMAGQNEGHLHYHVMDYSQNEERFSPLQMRRFILDYAEKKKNLIVFDNGEAKAVVGGIKSGQAFIVSRSGNYQAEHLNFSSAVSFLVDLYNRKFKSVQGLSPDFSIGLRFLSSKLIYGIYTPVLNHWGSAEHIALYEGCPITLPWPHEATAAHLTSR